MDLIIETRDIVKRFGKFTAVNGISVEVPEGSIYGFVGPNGAGKTTTMRMLTTLTRPTGGKAWVAGHSITDERRAVRRAIGYMPDEFGVYDDLRVWEYLDFFAACYDIPEQERKRLIEDLLELVDLAHRRDDMVDKLCRGMKQRLSLARTLAHDPSVLILDDPISQVDFETGATSFRVPTGEGLDYTNFGPPLVLGPDGAAYLGTMGGLLRVRDGSI